MRTSFRTVGFDAVLESRRIAVVGCCGSGKTLFARSLAQATCLPLVSLDDVYWGKWWNRPPADDWRAQVVEISLRDEWIIDGNFFATLHDRLERADSVVFFDLPTALCVFRVIRRDIARLLGDRSSLPERVRQSPFPKATSGDILGFWWFVARFGQTVRPKMLRLFSTLDSKVFVIKSGRQATQLMKDLHHDFR